MNLKYLYYNTLKKKKRKEMKEVAITLSLDSGC